MKVIAQWGEGSLVSRRRFFQFLWRDVVVAGEKLRGQQLFRLIDLPKFPDDDLSRIIPRLIEERCYWIDQHAFWTDDGVGGALRISDASPVELFLLDCFRGVVSIEEIAQRLAYHFDFDEPEAFRRTRGFFLLLAVKGLCAPANTSLWSTVEEPAASEDPVSLAEHNTGLAPLRRGRVCSPGSRSPPTALIVAPDGSVRWCYLREREWRLHGLDLRLGQLTADGAITLNPDAVLRLRHLAADKPLCTRCFCRWSCAWGCHVNHSWPGGLNGYNDFCEQTRIVTACELLDRLGHAEVADRLVGVRDAAHALARQRSDRVRDFDATSCPGAQRHA